MADVDVIVIGSGAGGLAAAVALAQAGQKVLVLEQHYVPGGWCHSFVLGGHRFSPGVHYVGELGPGGRMRALYEGLGVSKDVEFFELNPDGYDHVLVGDERFDIPRGKERFAERLKARFPRERAGIDAYLGDTQRICDELGALMRARGPIDALKLAAKSPTVMRFGMKTARSFIDAHLKDPLLRAIAAAQSGDHGLPPNRAPAPVHAMIAAHYFDGGFYPRGGGFTIPRAFVRALKRAGGDIRLEAPVQKILLERGRAVGVRLEDGTEIRARHVVSNADPSITYERLIGREHLPLTLRARLARTRWSGSALSLFFATDADVRGAGLDSGNYWRYAHTDLDAIYGLADDARALDLPEVPGLFLTCTTLKDPTKRERGQHTLEAFSFVPYDAFSRWAHTRFGDRPADYEALKAALQAKMIAAVERVLPAVRGRITFAELGTPLTNAHYVAATRGNLYGTEKSRLQVGPFGFQVGSAFEGLTLCGASTLGHGVMGATLSGLFAARKILRCGMGELLQQKGPSLVVRSAEEAAREVAQTHASQESADAAEPQHARG